MNIRIQAGTGATIFKEIREFAEFSFVSQRYIRRSLDVASGDRQSIDRWLDDPRDRSAVEDQVQLYASLEEIRALLRNGAARPHQRSIMNLLVGLSGFDLDSGELDGFPPYRFLYERLFGSLVRPLLPGAFCAVVLMPQVKPSRRVRLLNTLGDAVVSDWSEVEPTFRPEQIAA